MLIQIIGNEHYPPEFWGILKFLKNKFFKFFKNYKDSLFVIFTIMEKLKKPRTLKGLQNLIRS